MAIDIGNSRTNFGLFDGKTLVYQCDFETKKDRVADEYHTVLRQFTKIDGCIISTVVPSQLTPCVDACKELFQHEPLVVGSDIELDMKIHYDNPAKLGADRIADVVGAKAQYSLPLIVIDFGTATVFNVIDDEGDFRGGVIIPGMKTASDSLITVSSQLHDFMITEPKSVIATNTIEALQSGILYATVGSVTEIIARIKKELGQDVAVVATGGLVAYIAKHVDEIDFVNKNLTLEGLRIIFALNRNKHEIVTG